VDLPAPSQPVTAMTQDSRSLGGTVFGGFTPYYHYLEPGSQFTTNIEVHTDFSSPPGLQYLYLLKA
jgi:hypothetical protein